MRTSPVSAVFGALAAPLRGGAALRKPAASQSPRPRSFHGSPLHRDAAVVVMPGAVIFNAAVDRRGALKTDNGIAVQQGLRQWRWTADPLFSR
jgi:hypothetical protein